MIFPGYHLYERETGRQATPSEAEHALRLPEYEVLRKYVPVPPRFEPRLDANGRWHESAPIKMSPR